MGVPLFVLFIGFGVAALTKLDRTLYPAPYYTDFPNSLRVVESRMDLIETSNGLRIYIIGVLTNQGPLAWKGVEFECRFFDTNGVMVDAAHPVPYLTIQPTSDTAFRAVATPVLATNYYATYRLTVSTARNPKSLF